uniref:Uncharacterized protein n=1 Tax=Populus trichocarpa x Populus deltoides TaxID=3695 RepID=A9PK06_9ROSI|nr:unknown [Populus trichocarpa x Populus deltoides]
MLIQLILGVVVQETSSGPIIYRIGNNNRNACIPTCFRCHVASFLTIPTFSHHCCSSGSIMLII